MRSVVQGSAAEEAGVEAGDVIVGIDGTDTPTSASVGEIIRELEVGDEITLEIERAGERMEIPATLGRRG